MSYLSSVSVRRHCFILGLMPRSGTNWVYDMVKRSELYATIGPIWENNLLSSWSEFSEAADNWVSTWRPHWKENENQIDRLKLRSELEDSLIQGVLSFLRTQSSNSALPIVTKCPISRNAIVSDEMLDHIQVVLIVRNPMATVQSGMTAFGWSFFGAVEAYIDSSKAVSGFVGRRGTLVIKYEDLVSQWEVESKRVLDFLEIPVEGRQLARLPVRGQTIGKGKVASWSSKKSSNMAPSSKINLNLLQRLVLNAGVSGFADAWGYQTQSPKLFVALLQVFFVFRKRIKKMKYAFTSKDG